jgi:hypothetical protein
MPRFLKVERANTIIQDGIELGRLGFGVTDCLVGDKWCDPEMCNPVASRTN